MNHSSCLTPLTFDKMMQDMLLTEQSRGLTVYRHGLSVYENTMILKGYLSGQTLGSDWKLPKWIDTYKGQILQNLHDNSVVELYTVHHDCGKPYCKIVDDDGRSHFPDHAEVSKRVWLEVGGSEVVANLIGCDMDIHVCSAEEIGEKLRNQWSCKDSVTLLVASLAEIHSNAKMFGGLDSISFKSKFKQVDRRGKQICKHWFG